MTARRRHLLDILVEADSPLNASQVYERFRYSADLVTVYRGLRDLEQKELLSSFVFDCEERGVERYYAPRKVQHEHYMHCEQCHRFFVMPGCPFQSLLGDIENQTGFRVEKHFLTLKGVCSQCSG